MKYYFQSAAPTDTASLAKILADRLGSGALIALSGDLGAGKTLFTKSFAEAFGVEETVNSPTFTIIKEYQGTKLPLYHMDVYRISIEEAEELGLEEYFFADGVCIVEWANQITELLPNDYLALQIKRLPDRDEQHRLIELQPVGDGYNRLCRDLAQRGVIAR